MSKFNSWKQGWGIIFRFLYLSFIISLMLLPVRILERVPEAYHDFALVVAILYCAVIIPLYLPAILHACGLQSRKTGSFDEGGLNQASRDKMAALKSENEQLRSSSNSQ